MAGNKDEYCQYGYKKQKQKTCQEVEEQQQQPGQTNFKHYQYV